MTKAIARILLIAGVLALVVLLYSYSTSEAVGETFATKGIDLRIDSEASYNGNSVPSATWNLKDLVPGADKFFNFDDIKPGDYGENTISLHVRKTSAWLCVDFTNLEESDNDVNEPEGKEDPDGDQDGELAEGMEFFAWRDDCDNVYEPQRGEEKLFGVGPASELLDDKTYVIGDSKNGSACKVNETRCMGIFWCAGDLSVNNQNGQFSCDGTTLGNDAQTDSFSVDISLRAEPSKDKPKFVCGPKPPKPPHDDDGDDNDDDDGRNPPPPPPTPTPTPPPPPSPSRTPQTPPTYPNLPPGFPQLPQLPKIPSIFPFLPDILSGLPFNR